MKTYDLMGLEKNKSDRPNRRVLKIFFKHHDLEFFKYLDKRIRNPKHFKQRILTWVMTGMEWPELDNPHDDLAHHLWGYYEDKITHLIEPSPDTSGMDEQEERIVLENYYEDILSELKYTIWSEIDMKIKHPEIYTEDAKSDRKQKKHKKYIETRWPKFLQKSRLDMILTPKEIITLLHYIEDEPWELDQPPQFPDKGIVQKLYNHYGSGYYDDRYLDDEDVLQTVFSMFMNWEDDRHWEEHGEPPL